MRTVVVVLMVLTTCCVGVDQMQKDFIGSASPFSPWLNYKSTLTQTDIIQLSNGIMKRTTGGSVPPVIIVPSLLGSVLMGTLKDFKSRYYFCPSNWATPFRLWFYNSPTFFLDMDCWLEHMTLHLNASTYTSSTPPGVFVDMVDYGGPDLSGVAYLDAAKTMGVWNETIALLEALGYEAGKSLRAAPYDWRRGPVDYMAYDFPRLKQLTEETYAMNNNTPVAFVSLSMGGPYFLSFLNHAVTQEWKDKYVHSFTSMDGAFGGSTVSVAGLTSANFLGTRASFLSPWGELFRNMMQSFGAFVWMLPSAQFYAANVTVTTGKYGNFTTTNWPQMLMAAKAAPSALIMNSLIKGQFTTFKAPGVKMNCVFGTNRQTIKDISFPSDFNSNATFSFAADGDGVVLREGLDVCSYFQGQQKQLLVSLPVPGMEHGSSVHTKEVLAFFVRNLLEGN